MSPEQLHGYPPPTRHRFLAVGVAVLAALVLGYLIGSAAGRPHGTLGPQPTVTGTATPPAPASTRTFVTPAPTDLRPKDFQIRLQILGSGCSASLCSVRFRVHPSYIGKEPLPEQGRIFVSYKVAGVAPPFDLNFEVRDGRISADNQEGGTTSTVVTELKATVTGVVYLR